MRESVQEEGTASAKMEACLTCWKNNREASVAKAELVKGRVVTGRGVGAGGQRLDKVGIEDHLKTCFYYGVQ